jgi:hypothetical protein
MRFARLIIGSLVIAVAILVIAGEQLSGASADAVINARTTTLRAPIAGTLTLESQIGKAQWTALLLYHAAPTHFHRYDLPRSSRKAADPRIQTSVSPL